MESNSRLIVKNTMLLYLRMFLIMGVSLYTVRIVLSTLGVIDYGIYNVVAGIAVMFSFLSNTMATASQRYFSFELGKGDFVQLRRTFSMTIVIYILMAVVILLLAETIGLWFLNYRMVIPLERMKAANWVYQFSVFSFVITMFSVPYNALIIAREKMSVFAWVSIIEVLLKLLVVYLLLIFSYDKLGLYAALMFAITTLVSIINLIYCLRNFRESKFQFYWNKKLFLEITSYAGWNLFGALAGIFNNQGVDILLNIFFSPIVNTSRAIASRINSAISQFVSNFMIATRPQITKYYATGEKDEMLKLVLQSSKFSYLLLLIISLPVLFEAEFILSIWLIELPEYVVLFSQLTIIGTLIESLSYPLMAAAQATGKIRNYQVIIGGIMLLALPISFVILNLGYSAEYVFYVSISISIICLFFRLIIIKRMIGLIVIDYIKKVIIPLIIVTILACIIPFLLKYRMLYGIERFFVVSIMSVLSSVVASYLFGFTQNEKKIVFQFIRSKK